MTKDHITPQNEIKKMENYDKLTSKQKKEVLNNPENLQPLPGSQNSSKKAKYYANKNSDGTKGWNKYKGKKLPSKYTKWLNKEQKKTTKILKKQIDKFNKENKGEKK